jgi:hypothetical protein
MSTRKRKKKPKEDNPEQSRRFIEAAKKLGLGENSDAFDKALNKLVPKKRTRSS